ncbi:MAG TPA: Spy/CpxP family protein refolding chaperone [Longimicrobiales bacterium]|nr:Spy/CpxP family protein refolding chaperone [Longimicrobiales bacterium]
MRKLSILAVAALLGSAPAAAQEGHGQDPMPMHGQAMQGMQHCMAMMGGPPPQMLLQHREALGLSADQMSRLEALQVRARETAMPHMQPAMQTHMAAAELLKGDAPDFQGYEASLREAADHMVRAHVAMARVAVDARRVLTPEQRDRLDELGRGMMGGGEQGMMGGGHGQMEHGAMGDMAMGHMMGCMMTGGAMD